MTNRSDAIVHIWGLSAQVSGEFCCSLREHRELAAETEAALRALGVTDGELGGDD